MNGINYTLTLLTRERESIENNARSCDPTYMYGRKVSHLDFYFDGKRDAIDYAISVVKCAKHAAILDDLT